MKKLIALGIALMLMLGFAASALAAETATNFYGTAYTAGSKTNSMEWVLVTEGDTQTFKLNPVSDYAVSNGLAAARWLLLKINVGRGWFFSETTASTLAFNFYRVYTGDTTLHILPSGKAEWTKANNALQTGLTDIDKLAVPELSGEEPSGTYTATSNQYNKKCSVQLTADELEACYNKEDGCLYMTLVVTTTASNAPKLTTTASYQDGKYHSLKLYGTQALKDPSVSFEDALNTLSISNSAVTVVTNAGTGTAKLSVASYVDGKMVDVMVHTLSAEEAEGIHSVDISSLLPGTKKRAFLFANGTLVPLADAAKTTIKVACAGDSITYGSGITNGRETYSYPARLGAKLGEDYKVSNFGKPSYCVTKASPKSYWETTEYKNFLKMDADIVIIMFGTNDMRTDYWYGSDSTEGVAVKDTYIDDYCALIQSYRDVNPDVKVYIMTPPALNTPDDNELRPKERMPEEVIPRIKEVAEKTGANLIELYPLFENKANLFSDTLHPNNEGAEIIADKVYQAITGNKE